MKHLNSKDPMERLQLWHLSSALCVCVGIQDYSPIPALQLLHSILASIFSFHLVSNNCSVGSTMRQNRIPGISIALAPGVDGLGGCRVG